MLDRLFSGAERTWKSLKPHELNGAKGRDSWAAIERRLAELLER